MEQVTEFQYLETIVEENGTQEKEINKIIQKTIQLQWVLYKRYLLKNYLRVDWYKNIQDIPLQTYIFFWNISELTCSIVFVFTIVITGKN